MQTKATPQVSDLAKSLLATSSKKREEFARRSRIVARQFFFTSVCGDALIILGASALNFAVMLYFGPRDSDVLSLSEGHTAFASYFILITTALMLMLADSRAYQPAHLLRYRQESFVILKTCFIWSLSVLCVTRVLDLQVPLPRFFSLIDGACVALALLTWRYILHRIAMRERFSRYLRERIIFVGWNVMAERCATFIRNDPSQPYTLVGCIPSRSDEYEIEPPDDLPNLAVQQDLAQMLKGQRIDIVILADRSSTMEERDNLATLCEKELVQFKVIPSYFPVLVSGLSIQTISGIPVLGISHLPLDRPLNCCVKRTVDIIGSIVGLLLSAPIIAVFSILVYLESPGPVIYRPRRLGLRGREFDMIKIRSMRLDADREASGHWTLKDDPRRLKIGNFIRRWNIDELPQFWNVLKGDMSLVGPRPESVELIKSFKHEIPHYHARHSAKPGITGWAAVNGLRGDTDLRERIRCDLFYLERWSVWLDFQIMILTFFRHQGAG